ncbi:MAG: outer-membrane lipoprotein carrier protein LolA [Elusimicrobiales bacterium]|nr:outer-membrane lipoprotein carrier protein LolA [Elusimicrobiales bacterium]
MKFLISITLLFIILTKAEEQIPTNGTKKQVDIINEIKSIDEKIKTFISDYEQEIFFKTAEIKQKIEGKILFLKPNNIKIIHTKPQEQIIIIRNKKEITIVKPSDRQIITTNWERWKGALEPRLKGLLELGNYSKLIEKENTELLNEDNKKILLIKSKKNFYILKIVFNENNIPIKAELDLGETLVTTILKNTTINTEIKESEFKYKNKENYETLSL